jgi:cation-transporting ATPase 13A2
VYRFIRYQYDNAKDVFVPIVFKTSYNYQTLHREHSRGIRTEEEYQLCRIKYGPCNIEVPIKTVPRLLIEEVLNPFYIFQVFSMALWYWDGYTYYATCILIISVTSAITSLVETRRNLKNISAMANYSCDVNVMRSGDEHNLRTINSSGLVPGDVIEIPENTAMPCDLVLLTGSCIVNESMLTGESIPVIKNSLPYTQNSHHELYNPDADSKYTLYGGTKVI